MASEKKKSRSNGFSRKIRKSESPLVVCLDNEEYPVSLERLKIYRTLPDEKAARHGYLRIIDESGEDYLYPSDCFIPVPQSLEAAILRVS